MDKKLEDKIMKDFEKMHKNLSKGFNFTPKKSGDN